MEERVFDSLGGSQYIVKAKRPMEFEKADIAFAFGMLVCGFLFWNLIHPFSLGAGVSIFSLIICATTFFYMYKSGMKQNFRSLVCLALVFLSAVQFSIFDLMIIKGLDFLFLMMVYVYWVCLTTGRPIEKKLSIYIIGDAILQFIILPFSNFICCACGVKNSVHNHKSGKNILSLLIGIVVFLPILIGVIHLLISADMAFEHFAGKIYALIRPEQFFGYAWQFLLGIPVASYLYGLVYGNVKERYTDELERESMDQLAVSVRFAPRLTIYSALTAFNTVYFVFFAVQAVYFFSAFQGTLPETFTYAEYARRGFFELCTVAGINLAILTATYTVIKRDRAEEPRTLRIQVACVSAFTMLLIITAFSKMVMYIQSYGLTQLRVFTSWFMLLLFLIFSVVLVRQIKKFNASRVIIIGFIVLFMALAHMNVDGMIAKYNIQRYKADQSVAFDISAMADLSDAAVPYLYDLYLELDAADTDENVLKEELKLILTEQYRREIMTSQTPGTNDFRDFNWQRYRADQIRAELSQL